MEHKDRSVTVRRRGPGLVTLELLTRAFAPSCRTSRPPSKTVAIVVPVSSRPVLLPEEEIALRHLCHFLGPYDKYFAAPIGSPIRRDGFETSQFPRKFFGSPVAHNHLVFWPDFYRTFEEYEYILIYHLDSLVFSDELMRWCRAGWDYIGAPWLPCADTPWVKEARVGNGGFALMKVESVLDVLDARYRQKPASYWADLLTRNGRWLRPFFRTLEWLQPRLPPWDTMSRVTGRWRASENPTAYGYHNDLFWAYEAADYVPTFKVAPVEDGLRFAFEAAPRTCFELNGRQLPFGCHAWTKFDRGFWEPLLLPPAGTAPEAQPEWVPSETPSPGPAQPRPRITDSRAGR